MTRPTLTLICLLMTSALFIPPLGAQQAGGKAAVIQTGTEERSREEFGQWLVDRVGVYHATDYLVEILAKQEATERNLLPTDEETARAFDIEYQMILDEFYKGDQERYARDIELRDQNPSNHAARRLQELRGELILGALAQADRDISDEQIAKYYTLRFGPLSERTTLDVLFFGMYANSESSTGKKPDELRQVALARAQSAAESLRNGEPMSALLSESDPVNSDYVDEQGRVETYAKKLLGKEVDTALRNMDILGEVSSPISVFDGYYVVRLANRAPVEKDEVRSEIISLIQSSPANSTELLNVRQRLLDQDGAAVLLR
jgi:hypothetical protein